MLATEGAEGENANESGEQNFDNANGATHDVEMANGDAAPQEGEASGGGEAGVGMGGERQANKVRVTTPYLTKYERARVLGTRALQIRCVL